MTSHVSIITGEYYLLRSDAFLEEEQTEEQRDGVLTQLAHDVSCITTQRWFPLSNATIEERLVAGHAGSLVVPEKYLTDRVTAMEQAQGLE